MCRTPLVAQRIEFLEFTEFSGNTGFFLAKSFSRIAETGKLFMLEENPDGRLTKAAQKSTGR
jgi:hypothetical protein